MGKRKVVIELLEEVTSFNTLHIAEVEIDVDESKDTLGDIETKANAEIHKVALPEHIDKRVKDDNDPLTVDKIQGRMRL